MKLDINMGNVSVSFQKILISRQVMVGLLRSISKLILEGMQNLMGGWENKSDSSSLCQV